jgi:hypothetical protein
MVPTIVFSQVKTGYYLTNEQHELLRKDLDDYKILINEFEQLKRDFELLKLLNAAQKKELDKPKVQPIDEQSLLIKISTLEAEKKKLFYERNSLKIELEAKNENYLLYKGKYFRELKKNLPDRIIGNGILGTIIACGLLIIWSQSDH